MGASENTLHSLKLTAKAPENGWLEDESPLGMDYFQGQTVTFRECNLPGKRRERFPTFFLRKN